MEWNKRQKRLYGRVLYGCARPGKLRLVLLTSSPESPRNIEHSFRVLKERIRRRGKFEYIGVREVTKSGLLHIHLLYRGKDLDGIWLSRVWKKIHKARIVFVRRVKGAKGLGSYLAKYLTKEMLLRPLMSWGWIYRGWRESRRYLWSLVTDRLGYDGREVFFRFWRKHLEGKRVCIFGRMICRPEAAERLYIAKLKSSKSSIRSLDGLTPATKVAPLELCYQLKLG